MKKYEAYKNSGIEWIGDIPEGWGVSRIKHLLEQSKDGIKIGPFGSALTGKVDNEGAYKVYGQWNIVGKDFKAGKNFVSAATFRTLDSYHIYSGDLFISMMGTVGKCAIIPKDVAPGIMDSHVVKARLDESKMIPKYFEYVYDKDNSNIVYSQIQKYRKGSIMDGLNSTLIKEFYMPVPTISEQQAIASYLDHKVGQIDASVSAINTQINELKAYRQSIISETVTKGLNPDAPMKDSGIEGNWIIPSHWTTNRMKFLANIVRGGSPRPIEEYIADEGYNWIKIGDTIKGYKYIESTKEKIKPSGLSATREVHSDDLILSNSMSFGQPYILKIDGCIHDGWLAFTEYKGIDKEYLYYVLQAEVCSCQFKHYVAGGVVQNLNIEKVGSTYVPVPPISEQQSIANYLDNKTAKIDSCIATLETQSDELNKLKQSIISEAVTGKIDVRDWNPCVEQ